MSSAVRRRAPWIAGGVAAAMLLLTAGANAQTTPRGIENACPPGEIGSASFADTAGNAHEAAIDCLAYYGITTGATQTTYSPAAAVRRDQMASFIARFLELFIDLPADPADRFADVPADNPHRVRINQLADVGIVGGFADGSYRPGATVLRDQMTSFLNRALEELFGAPLASDEDAFADDDGNPHEANINALAAEGIVAGVGGGDFAPRAGVRRDQMASFIMRTGDYAVVTGGQGRIFTTIEGLLLTGYAEVGPGPGLTFGAGERDNLAFAVLRMNSSTGRICYWIRTERLSRAYTAAHVHVGAMDENGPVVVTLEAPDPATGTADGCIIEQPATVAAIEEDLTGHYLNVHSEQEPDGALRAQLGTEPLLSYLSWAFELEATDTGFRYGAGERGADGLSFMQVDAAGGQLCAFLTTSATVPYTGAHIHLGGMSENGDIVIEFSSGAGRDISDCVDADPADLTEIIDNRDDYYVNVHNLLFPDGAVRAQLDSGALTVPLSGEEEVDDGGAPAGEDGATGTWYAQLTWSGQLCYLLETDATGPFVGAHIHEGARGVNGPIFVNMALPEPEAEGGTSLFSHCIDVDSQELFFLDTEQHYFNVHTEQYPAGAVRGQLVDGIPELFRFSDG